MKIVIHHITLSHTSPYITGGETALVEIVRYLSKFDNISQIIYTSESGADVYKKQLRGNNNLVKYVIIGSINIEKINDYLAYYLRVFQQFKYLRKFDKSEENIIFSHEEFLPTLIFSFLLRKINNDARWFAFFHMKCPSIWRGFEGEYTGKYKLPSLRLIRYKLEQCIFFKLTINNVNKIITVNPCYKDFLSKIYNNSYTFPKPFERDYVHVIKNYSGVKVNAKKSNKYNKYDLCFMARFHEQKGVFEIIDILKIIKESKPDISLAMMGGGVKRIESIFFEIVKKEGLENNISYLGYVIGPERYSVLFQSKIFLFPSYYESFGQSALEAMKCGLPVVAYDLPPLNVFKRGMVKVPVLDNDKMAEEILKLLDNKNYYNKIRTEAIEFSSNFSWDKTGKEIYNIIIS